MFRSRASAGAAAAAPGQKPDRQWRAELTPLQYRVLRRRRTELFRSGAKFASRTGWPSFSEPALAHSVDLRRDRGMFGRRTAVACRRCGGHLGLVFGDGPTATGDRYCINSCALAFEAAAAADGAA